VALPKGKVTLDVKRKDFMLTDMARLHKAALEGGNQPLTDLIELG
jgi:hypothetical protein